jgi:hypothetical protein
LLALDAPVMAWMKVFVERSGCGLMLRLRLCRGLYIGAGKGKL